MINDQQVKKLRSDLNGGMRLAAAALRSGMSEKTARKYRNMNQLPSEAQQPHHWRTRIDPFESVWARSNNSYSNRQASKPKPSLSPSSGNTRAGSKTDNYARCSDASSNGAPPRVPPKKFTSNQTADAVRKFSDGNGQSGLIKIA